MIFNHVGGPGEGATVTAVAVDPHMTDWARKEPDSLQEAACADGEEGTWPTAGQQQKWLVFVRGEDAVFKAVQASIHGILISLCILNFLAIVVIPAASVLV